ncbi:MAG: quinone-interacting membrane-bound oxidoreductase complex subunit QmoC [FCB group bacterium]|nr:quinone-interacting membrane-bound oxidoreductase complex subunit QmoC [FCB group bacterium]
MPDLYQAAPDMDFLRFLKKSGGDTLKKCYQCAACSIVCNLSPSEKPFPRKEMMWAQWGFKDKLIGDPDIWLCHQCNDCSVQCPREARPGDVLAALRQFVFQHFAFPSFMGKALSNPAALPWLLFVPALIMLLIMFAYSADDLSYIFHLKGEVEYARIFPHGILEILFMGGNIMIFAFAAVGLIKFWNSLKNAHPGTNGKGFIPSLIDTVIELIPHNKFSKCVESKQRYFGHLLIFYGFIGAMATAGFALFFTQIVPILESPIDLANPIKILGGLSGIAIFIGGIALITYRSAHKKSVGVGGYSDWLFLNVIFAVGISGMLTWILRVAGIPLIAYIIYFIHLTLVFFLLWYAPYSKFAHMFYRTLALVYAKSVGRDKPRNG